jgi:glycosyltransferase involved in cell wall biosynthesis
MAKSVNACEAAPSPVPAGSVALVHDYLTQRGGAERLMLAIARAFPGAPLHASLYDAGATFPDFRGIDVRPLAINRLPLLRHNHRLALPLLAAAFSATTIDAPVTLVSSSGWAHGVRVTGRKLVYCHAPARWLYQRDRYLGGRRGAAWAAIEVLGPPLRRWDRRAARSADRYLCNSTAVQRRIRECYGIEAQVIHPPDSLDPFGLRTPIDGLEPGFLLCVSRLLPYKNVDAVIAAAAAIPGRQTVIAGDGPEMSRLRGIAGPTVRFTGRVDDARLRWLYANCSGLVAASFEDFGLTPVEAACFGKPVAALRDGGYIDTVIEGSTGVFFDDTRPASIARALGELIATSWDDAAIRHWSAQFDETVFAERLQSAVRDELAAGGA